MNQLILIKLGGSLITDKNNPFTPNLEVIERLAKEIKKILIAGKFNLIVGHGSGSFGHVTAKLYQTQKGFINDKSPYGAALVQDSASQLNRIVVKKFLEEQVRAVTISPSSSLTTKDGKISEWNLTPLLLLLKNKMLPIVYGDVVPDEKKGCTITSTEVLLNYLAINLKKVYQIEKIIYLGDTSGVWDENKKIIPLITPKTYISLQKNFGASRGIDVTGGMDHKMSEAIEIAKKGIEVVIANGKTTGILTKIIMKEKGDYTTIKNTH
jgi:isopentenyl phosphate kinase